MRRVVVTGLGIISPLGLGVKQTWQSLLLGRSGTRALTSPEFASLQCKVAGLIPQKSTTTTTATNCNPHSSNEGWQASDHLTPSQLRHLPTFIQYALVATREALADSSWTARTTHHQERSGICLGSGIGAFADLYATSLQYSAAGAKKVSPHFVPKLLINLAAGQIAMEFGFKGPCHAASTACTTGAHSIGDAARFIQLGDADVMLAGGAEACIHPLAITGFERSRSLCVDRNDHPGQASRPFDERRAGFVMGEGAGVMVLEEREHALARAARVYAELVGYGATCDAYHVTQPLADGDGAYRSMRRALQVAGLRPRDVDYVNAHATSTVLGDVAEARAMQTLMLGSDGGVDSEAEVCVSSTKGATGHLLGAAGAVEACFAVLAIRDGMVPPTVNLVDVDDDMPKFEFVKGVAKEKKVDVVLTNSFGFGGTNATLCFRSCS